MECPTCGTPNSDSFKFCFECGTSLAGAPIGTTVPGEEDLRRITVIFSDLSGYTAITERLAPDETKAITSRIFSEAGAIARKYEGRLDRLVGDCALILFGIPHLHEDDAVRALMTAMEIHAFVDSLNTPELVARLGRSLAMHTGVNTGTVLAGRTDLEAGTETVVGDAVNLASRLKDTARAGQILAGPGTFRMTASLFEYETVPPVRFKGKTAPVATYCVLGLKAKADRTSSREPRAVYSPLVGREDAVAAFTRCLERLGAGQGAVVFVLGEAGLGKSRLIAEVQKRTRGVRPSMEWLEGSSLSYGRIISYWPFQEMVRRYTDIVETDSDEEAWRKLESRIRDLFDGDTDEVLPYIASLLSMDVRGPYAERVEFLDSEVMGGRVYLASRRFFERLARKQPVVLIFEDLHWMDESSALLLEHLLPLVERVPLLICCVSRPDPRTLAYRLRESAARDYSSCYTELQLAPLSRKDSERLAGNLMELADLAPHIQELVVGKAEGNPFFLEEIIRALIDTGAVVWDPAAGRWKATSNIETTAIPDSVQGLIMTRVDRLEQTAKQLLRTASVIGRSFLHSVLHAVVKEDRTLSVQNPSELDRHLADLQAVEIIHKKQQLPELEYIFKHALVRDAIYESIPLQRRRELHAHVGQVIEALFADRVEEFYGLLAYHYGKAEAWEKARKYLLMSGDQAERVAADTEALALYRQAMAVYMDAFGGEWAPLERALVERKMGEAFSRQGEHSLALDHLRQALAYLGKPLPGSRLGIWLAILSEVLGQASLRLIPWLPARHAGTPDDQVVQEVARTYESICWILATYDSELALLSMLKLVNSSERNGFLPGLVNGFSFLVYLADSASLHRLADSYAAKVLSLIELVQSSGTIGQAHAVLAIHENTRARWARVREHAQCAIEAYRAGGYWNIRGWRLAIVDFADADVHEGNFTQALAHARDLVRLGQESGDRGVSAWGLARQGFAQKGLGKLHDSIESLKKAMELLKAIPDYFVYVDCGGELGQCHLRLGEMDNAMMMFEECRRLRLKHKMMKSPMCTRFINGLAEAFLLSAEKSDAAKGAEWLRKAGTACAQALKQGKAYLPGMPEAMMLRGRYEWLRGRLGAAEKWWQQSLALAERIGVRYDLGRTLLEIGKRMGEHSYLERAKALFTELSAKWDLARSRAPV